MIRNLRKLFTLITLSVLAELSLFAQTESSIKNVFWQPNELRPGSVTFFTVELNREATKVSGQFLGKELLFFYSGKPGVWYSLAAVDVETAPGTYDLRIRVALPGGRVARTVKPVEIGSVTFKTGDVRVPVNFVKPDEAGQRKIAADQRLERRTFAYFVRTAQWSGNFIKPVEAPPTDSFGPHLHMGVSSEGSYVDLTTARIDSTGGEQSCSNCWHPKRQHSGAEMKIDSFEADRAPASIGYR
jgi:hypothetical protein